MKKGKIILGVATAVISVGSFLAFKVARISTPPVYGKTSGGVCRLCASLFTHVAANHHAITCNTQVGGGGVVLHGQGLNQQTWYTKTVNNACTDPITKVTISQ